MRIENIDLTMKMPLPIDRPDGNGVVYTKEAFIKAFQDAEDKPLEIINDDGSTTVVGVVHGIEYVEDDFVELAGEDAWWRSCTGSNLGFPDTKFKVNGESLLGWNRWDKKRKKYENLSNYLCECVGASTEKNVCACSVDLAKYNHMTMAELFEKYAG